MIRRKKLKLIRIMTLLFAMNALVPVNAAPPVLAKLVNALKRHGRAPETCTDPAVEELAANVDWLEHNIDRWGSIVAKSPDIWGEARLTKYRREVEEELEKQRGKFKQTLAGASSTRDTALLAASLQMSLGGASESGMGDQVNIDVSNTPGPLPLPTPDNSGMIGEAGIFTADKLELEPTVVLDQHRRYLDHLNELRRINEGDDAADAPGYSINLVRIPISVLPGSHTTHGYGAELTATATIQLDEELLPNTFRDLVINDLVDQLGLPMTRFLNSDPAKVAQLLATYKVGLKPFEVIEDFNQFARMYPVLVDDDLLYDSIVKRLVSQNQWGRMQAFIFDDTERRITLDNALEAGDVPTLEQDMKIYQAHIEPLMTAIDVLRALSRPVIQDTKAGTCPDAGQLSKDQCARLRESAELLLSYGLNFDFANRDIQKIKEDGTPDPSVKVGKFRATPLEAFSAKSADRSFGIGDVTGQISSTLPFTPDRRTNNQKLLSLSGELTADLKSLLSATGLPASLTRRSTLPFPPSELLAVYGTNELGCLALATHDALKTDVINRHVVHLTDVQSFLREELAAAYELLVQPEFHVVWETEMSEPRIVSALRGHRHAELSTYRQEFMQQLATYPNCESVNSLAWAIFVESVLLNDKMNREITTSSLGVACDPSQPMDFFGPNPSQQARDTFAAYVSAKWPLRIFTIDPVDNDQNIADTASIARQMQFAAAFAVASGEMSSRAAMNFSRNLQRDFATVSLNRTATGFVHGDNTFGWRFQPRFQTPPVQNNAVVIFRDLIGGGPTDNALRRQQRLEPGMRECVAMVLTPSFVSGVTIDTRSNWYRLNKPGHSALSMQEIAEQSRSIVAMRRAAETCVRRPDLYRDGEVERMLRRVEQLDRELPLQTLQCQLPNSNTLGGFELFSSGTRELAPELLGWYGSPGYQPGVDKQVFFLVGDNFSVHETKVIVGTKEAATMLLSRQIMQVTLPKDVPVINDDRLTGVPGSEYGGYIDAHVATPYGVSGHMLIPVLKPSEPTPEPKVLLKATPSVPAMQVSMTLKLKDGQYETVGNIVVSHAPVASIEIPTTIDTAKAGLLGSTVDVVFSPTAGSHALKPAVLAGLKVSAGKLSLGTPELIDALNSKGTLYASIEPYGLWLANGSINFAEPSNADLMTKGVDLKVGVALRGGEGKENVPIGELPLRLVFHQG